VNDRVRRARVLACLASRRYGGLALVGLANVGVDVVSGSLTGSCHMKQRNVSAQCPIPGEKKGQQQSVVDENARSRQGPTLVCATVSRRW
jgi:hypothetical protein